MTSSLALLGQVRRLRALRASTRPSRASRHTETGETLLGFVPRVSPLFASPQHLHKVADLYQRVAAGESVKAVVCCPPRHGKTELELHAIAWLLSQRPAIEIGFAAYGAAFARKKSRRARDLARRAGVPIDPTARSVTDWRTGVEGGGMWATSIGGQVTGEGFHCFPAGTRVQTEAGPIDIDRLCSLPAPPRVLSYDHASRVAVWCDIRATRRVKAHGLVEVATHDGRVVRCTPEHKFYVAGSGYRTASSLRPGDRLVASCAVPVQSLRSDVRPPAVRAGKVDTEWHDGPVLLARLPVRHEQRPAEETRFEAVCCVRQRDAQVEQPCPLRARVSRCGRGSPHSEKTGVDLPGVRCILPVHQQPETVLRPRVCLGGPLGSHGGRRELSLQDWYKLREAVQRDAAACDGSRRTEVCCLPSGRGDLTDCLAGADGQQNVTASAPHRRESGEQLANESDHSLQNLSLSAPQVGEDTVAVVRHLRDEYVDVYDLDVGECHNFFAGEILVHNCLLIDDPIKGRREAESGHYRETVNEWFRSDAITRLHPGGSCIVTHTRWHPDDLAGVLIRDGWELVLLPALDEHGAALWPERYDAKALESIRESVGEYNWASLYQGQPRPRGGAVFHDVVTYQTEPAAMRVAIGIDFAYTAKTHADYSVAVVLALSEGKLFVLEVVRQQVAAPDFAATLKVLKSRYPNARMVAYIGGTEKGVVDLLNATHRLNIIATPAKTDKFVRAQGAAASWNAGRIAIRSGAPWSDVFLGEVCGFTGVSDPHDDQVDALVAAHDCLSHVPTDGADILKLRRPAPYTRI